MLIFALSAAALASPLSYVFDPAASQLTVQVYRDRDTLASAMAHDHVVLATGWSGSLSLDPEDPTSCAVEVTVPVAGLRPDLPEQRAKAGYEVMLTDAQQKQVDEHMKGKEQLMMDRFPTIRFEASSCSGSAEALTAQGRLTVAGHAAELSLPVTIEAVDGGLRIRGGLQSSHSALGLSPYSAFFGSLKNQEALDFSLDVLARIR